MTVGASAGGSAAAALSPINGAVPIVGHNLLDGAIVLDSVASAVARGSLVVGNSTPKWGVLAIGGSATFLRSNGTDPSWQAIADGDLPSTMASKTLSGPTLSGTVAGTPTISGAWTWSSAQSFPGITSTTNVTIASGTITVSTPAVNATQTWNAGGVTFTAVKYNITDTASAAASLLMDLQVASTSKFSIDKSGVFVSAQGTLTANDSHTITQTWNNVAVGFSALNINITDTSSQTNSYFVQFQVASADVLHISKNGDIWIRNSGTVVGDKFADGAWSITFGNTDPNANVKTVNIQAGATGSTNTSSVVLIAAGVTGMTVSATLITLGQKLKFTAGTTGAGTPAFGSNSPATVNTAPYTWIQAQASDGTNIFIPAWK